jgi:hypothetical protein
LSDEVATLLAQKFIARRNVKAVQHQDGSWSPHTTTGKRDGERIKWRMSDLNAHLEKTATYGHYLLNEEDQCKLFAFDIDLEKNNPAKGYTGYYPDESGNLIPFDAREAWGDRRHPGRDWLKMGLMLAAQTLGSIVVKDLELPCAVAYSGSKGVHVYAFTGLVQGIDAFEGGKMVMDLAGEFAPSRGENFYRSIDQSGGNPLRNVTIEIFPKQASLNGKDLGNLMRLPLGRNLRSPKDPTFFVDMSAGTGVMQPIDAVTALTTTQAWRSFGGQ